MRQTLFYIPDDVAGWPLFGFGILLGLWLLGASIAFFVMVRRQGWTAETKSFLPFMALVAAAVAFVLPAVKTSIMSHEVGLMLWQSQQAQPTGLPIRGYGIFLLIATISGVGLAVWRAKKVGLLPDAIFSLAFYMFVGGILGARLFFIIQYWEQIYVPGSLQQTVANMVNFVEGGLVVYGSLIGALVAGMWFLYKARLPALAIADLIAPSLVLGLAIGRIGCLMNGCCYGGLCSQPWALTFPPESPPYFDQHRSGEFYGFRISADEGGKPVITRVTAGGPASDVGLTVGLPVESINGNSTESLLATQRELASTGDRIRIVAGGKSFDYRVGELPARSYPVHPTQIYSSLNAVLLCIVTLAYFPFRRRDGEVFTLLIAMYAVTRFLLEVIRTDEGGMWDTGMTISQNVSVGMLIGVVALTIYISRQPRGTFWPTPA